jgi:GAF domain-containing protein
MQITRSHVGTLRLLDPTTNELTIEVIQGPGLSREVIEAARKLRVPLGEGLAGWVAASGQPIVRTDLAKDPVYAAEAQKRIGYVPNSTLCIPLTFDDGILGVIELFDKADGEAFSAGDMDVLGLFGEAAAVAISQSQLLDDVTRLFGFMLQRLLSDASDQALLQDQPADLIGRAVQESSFRDAIQIALTAGQIARQGPEARRVVLQVLGSFADYLRFQQSRATIGGLLS